MIRRGDAFGQALSDALSGADRAHELVERSDGFITPGPGPGAYFSAPRLWPRHEREAIRFARGRVLDVGCGAGRHAIHLQGRGHGRIERFIPSGGPQYAVIIEKLPISGR